MRKLVSELIVLAGVTMISGAASAASLMTGPFYIGERSANAEQETYAYLATHGSNRPLGFLGPARSVGVVTGNAEEATIGYRPLIAVQENGRWSFQLAER